MQCVTYNLWEMTFTLVPLVPLIMFSPKYAQIIFWFVQWNINKLPNIRHTHRMLQLTKFAMLFNELNMHFVFWLGH
jgi:hypothetical protein